VVEFLANCLVVCASGLADQLLRHQASHLTLELWAGAMSHLQRRLLRHSAFLRVLYPAPCQLPSGRACAKRVAPAVEEPILCLLEVRSLFDALGAQLCDTLMPLANLAFLLPAAVRGLGAVAPLLVAAHFALLRGCQLLAPDIEGLQSRTGALEGRFQAWHSRLRATAEAVAASGGAAAVRCQLEAAFKALQEHSGEARRREFLYRTAATFFSDYRQLPTWTQRVMSLCFARRNGPLDPGNSLSVDILCANFLFDRMIQAPQIAMQHLVRCTEKAARIDSQCKRYLELLVACELASRHHAPPGGGAAQGAAPPLAPYGSGRIAVRGLDMATQRGECLAKNLTFEVEVGNPLLVTGPSGSGKSLLGGVLLGLWPAQGRGLPVSLPGAAAGLRPPLQTLMPSPQRPYLPAGCRLVAQLAYPTVLRLPSRPPFKVHVAGLPPAITEAALQQHFEPLGGVVRLDPPSPGAFGGSRCLVAFRSFDEVLRAVARPQDRVISGTELECELTDFREAQAGASAAAPVPGDPVPRLARMRRSLAAVGLEHVLAREPDGWFARRAWEDALSGGEQQRLCLARVLYHGPAFALLDDCSRMLPACAEAELHVRVLREWGITPIALAQRAFLPGLYTQELRLGVEGGASYWELHEHGGPPDVLASVGELPAAPGPGLRPQGGDQADPAP